MEARIPAAHPEAEILTSVATRPVARHLRLGAIAARSALLFIALMLSGMPPAQAQDRVLVPWQVITGGRFVAQLDSSGYPLSGEPQGFLTLVFPSSLAVRGPDLFIADSGARKIYRFDATQQVLSAIPGIDAGPRTRLQIGLDQTLFVLDAGSSAVLHISRAGQLLESLSDTEAEANLGEFVVAEHSGQIVAGDRRSGRLIAMDSVGWAKRPYPAVGTSPSQLGALASRGRNIYAVDKNCTCIIVLDEEGQVIERIGQGTLVQPHALATDHYGRLFIADAFNQKLWVYFHGKLIASYEARKLHANEISALAVDEGVLYIADGPGGQVIAFHVRPPSERRQ